MIGQYERSCWSCDSRNALTMRSASPSGESQSISTIPTRCALNNATASSASAASSAAGSAAASHGDKGSDYFIDTLFRDDRGAGVSEDAAHGTVARIFAHSLANDGQLSSEDRTYLAQIIAQRTNLSQPEAEQRVDQVYAKAHQAVEEAKVKAKEAADTAAKVAAWTTLWMFITLLIGAFFASLCATFGGRRRDAVTYLTPTTTTPLV